MKLFLKQSTVLLFYLMLNLRATMMSQKLNNLVLIIFVNI